MINNKVFKRFLLTFICIVVLYTTLVTTLVGYKNYEFLKFSNNYSNELYLNEVRDILDYKLDIAFKFTNKISTLDSVINYLKSESINYAYANDVHNDLKSNLSSFDQLGFTVGVTKFTDNFVISPSETLSYDGYLDKIDVDKYYLAYLDKLFKNKPTKSGYYVVPEIYSSENSRFITIIRQVNYSESQESLYFFITFDKNNLLPNTLPNNKGAFSIATNEIVNSYKSTSYANFDLHSDDISNLNISNKVSSTETNNKNIIYSIKSNSLVDINYIYTLKKKDLAYIDVTLIKSLFILNINLLILGIVIIYFATKRSYRPIQDIIDTISVDNNTTSPDLLPDPKYKFDELEYITSNIKKINSINNNLQNSLSNSLSSIQENLFRNILYGLVFDDTIQKSISDAKLNKYLSGGTVCILSLEGKSEIEGNLSKNNILAFRRRLLSVFSDDIDYICISLDYKTYCLIFDEKDHNKVNENISNIINTLENDLSVDITSAIAKSVSNINDFKIAFDEANTLINKKYSYIDTRVISSNSIDNIEHFNYYYPLENENFIINYINNNNIDMALQILTNVLNKNIEEMNLDNHTLLKLKHSLINTIKRILNQNDKSITDFSKSNSNLIDNFNKCGVDTLLDTSLNLFKFVFDTYLTTDVDLDNPLATNILLYIQNNFDKDISLTTISDNFNLSEGYVSKLLKSTANINFKSYVNALKVSKAKELLLTNKYKVNEVSKLVGCENTNTFIRIFKKQEGISPGEFLKVSQSNI